MKTKIELKSRTSETFRQVANLIKAITDEQGNILNDSDFTYLAVCPWTRRPLVPIVQNINTTLFCQLFPSLKPTTVERHLRRYKEYHRAQVQFDLAWSLAK